jgi:hypothetical protein
MIKYDTNLSQLCSHLMTSTICDILTIFTRLKSMTGITSRSGSLILDIKILLN